jgi:multidrug efflux system outer membrane protein
MMNVNRSRVLLLLILMIFGAVCCSPFRPKIRESPEGELPPTFSLYTSEREGPNNWWEEFEDPELNALVQEALFDSFTLKGAWARLNQAKSLAVQAGSDLYPQLSLTAGGSYSRQRTEDDAKKVMRKTIKDFSLGLAGSYELDLWGKIRSEREAALLEATASLEDFYTAAMTLSAEVTERWISIISQRMQKRLLKKQLETNQTYLELIELRFQKAMVSALDVYQQRQVVAEIKAQIPLVEAQEQLLLHEIALLLGKPPRTSIKISRETMPVLGVVPATGLPADLLSNRPDVRAAGLRLRAADWQVSAARANRLPTISLSATGSFSAADLALLFQNWIFSLAGNLVTALIDGNRRAAEVDRTRAVADENLLFYKETVLKAIKDVENALVSETKQQEHIDALLIEIDAARKALVEARERYLKGIDDYLPVLTQIQTVQKLDRDLVQQQAVLVVDRVSLYRALGGSWTTALQPNGSVPGKRGT